MVPSTSEPIAIVGVGCRFPGGANTSSRLWELLKKPRDVAKPVPPDKFNLHRFYHPHGNHHGTTNVSESYFLEEDVRRFDCGFFGISPGEAEAMDPQHRLLLETVFEATESGGLTYDRLNNSDTSVFIGLMCSDYYVLQAQNLNRIPTYNATGIANSNASSRISYFFNWHGPSVTIDTACSSSLVAVHQAVQTLRSGVSRTAVAAGTNLLLSPLPYISESKLNMLSPEGRSKMWDSQADGYARGEGVAAVVLKPLSAALQDGDPVQAIIRETGVNQDGRTRGITMPSNDAQAALITNTYLQAGLDPLEEDDRCQYFEAHGTGTPAGDPREAEGISTAFFKPNDSHDSNQERKIYCGSIKTVVGHTEGTAGIAGLLKACLALKHATIPPNLHFHELNSAIEPYYRNLKIPTTPCPWPTIKQGIPRRASVNSFGFGGTNAHVILESHERSKSKPQPRACDIARPPLIPFLFSANSARSLRDVVLSLISYLEEEASDKDLRNLAYSLACRKSTFRHRLALSAANEGVLVKKMFDFVQDESKAVITTQNTLTILAVFTGQGSQWPQMGRELVLHSEFAQKIIENLDSALQSLPVTHDRPSWRIKEELLADPESSSIHQAEFSQPLCTAVQIMITDILQSANVQFKAVIGHSSGEIAAAYAAGFLSAEDAIRVAYYRGFYSKLAFGPAGREGAMMAVGTTQEDASDLCQLDNFKGRIDVAAYNSATSITLSGDSDAIFEAKAVFDEEKKFTRILKVDKAYHSAHMGVHAQKYKRSLERCDINVRKSTSEQPLWFSSVRNGQLMQSEDCLKSTYWADNMLNPVLFLQAMNSALQYSTGPLSVVLEIGPHPALKSPATETIENVIGSQLPYFGTLKRGKCAIESIADTLGSLWAYTSRSNLNFEKFQETCCDDPLSIETVPNLPNYPWNHDQVLWSESRSTRLLRTAGGKFHDLLGVSSPDSTHEEWRWQNVLLPKEIPWLSGHVLQGQIIYPATGYIALAMEAAVQLANGRSIQMIELFDLEIKRAIAISDAGTDVSVTMNVTQNPADSEGPVLANFLVHSSAKKDGVMTINASGNVKVSLGPQNLEILAPRAFDVPAMTAIDIDAFYNGMLQIGYSYDGPFKSLNTLARRLGFSTGSLKRPSPLTTFETDLLFHPGMLDSALQALFAAYSSPGDGRLWAMHAPTSIKRVSLVPALCGESMTELVGFDCVLTDVVRNSISGDISVFTSDFEHKMIEIDGLSFSPFSPASVLDDRHLFSKMIWDVYKPDGKLVLSDWQATSQDQQKAIDIERTAFYYLRKLRDTFANEDWSELPLHRKAFLMNASRVSDLVSNGGLGHTDRAWLHDSNEKIEELIESYDKSDVDFQLTRAVGENLETVIRGEGTILEYMTAENKLHSYYQNALGLKELNFFLGKLVSQAAHRRPQMKILEIGAGTGAATHQVLAQLDSRFASYTFTDISTNFFEKAKGDFEAYSPRIIYQHLDIEKPISEQGFDSDSYDLVLAANVLHATKSIEDTLRNVRSLLKPDGQLALLEIVNNDALRFGLVMGGLPGWWVGYSDGRPNAPTITLDHWDSCLKSAGFSGVDTYSPLREPLAMPGSVFMSQAVDHSIHVPDLLKHFSDRVRSQKLVILIGKSDEIRAMAGDLLYILRPCYEKVIVVETLRELEHSKLGNRFTLLSLADLVDPVFQNLCQEEWESMKQVFTTVSNVLWNTRRAFWDSPYAALAAGFFRSLVYEIPQSKFQLLDHQYSGTVDTAIIVETLLRIEHDNILQDEVQQSNVLLDLEPELVFDGKNMMIPRVIPHKEQNDRYNSAKRRITKTLNIPSPQILRLKHVNKLYTLHDDSRSHMDSATGEIPVEIYSSLSSAINTPAGYLFLSMGSDKKNQRKVLCVSTENASKVMIQEKWLTPITFEPGNNAQYLSFVAGYISCQQIMELVPYSSIVMVHEPEPVLTSLLSRLVSSKNSRAVFTTSSRNIQPRRNWLYLHSRSTKRMITDVLPRDVSVFLNWASHSSTQNHLASQLAESLPETCKKYAMTELISKSAFVSLKNPDSSVSDLLLAANDFAFSAAQGVAEGMPLKEVTLREITTEESIHESLCIINWTAASTVDVDIQPVTSERSLFEAEKTYWLVGLSGDLGQSICDFMIKCGAKHIVFTSRASQPPEDWIQHHEAGGAVIKSVVSDITDLEALSKARAQIEATMPMIAGVANGALVLRDAAVSNMDFETFQSVLKPKAQGTANLDNLFGHSELDFFIVFSSISATTGNFGQTAYSASNCFAKAVVANRRKRKLAGSIMDISRVLGVGYIERATKGQALSKFTREEADRLMQRSLTLAMSEPDLHQLFTEAVLASNNNNDNNNDQANPLDITLDTTWELISGLQPVSFDEARSAFWGQNPRFSNLVQVEKTDKATAAKNANQDGSSNKTVNVKEQIQQTNSSEEIRRVVIDALSHKLKTSLYMSEDQALPETVPLIDAGVDSLMAVEVRTWALRELALDLPVLTILGGASLTELAEFVVEKLDLSNGDEYDDGQNDNVAGGSGIQAAEIDEGEQKQEKHQPQPELEPVPEFESERSLVRVQVDDIVGLKEYERGVREEEEGQKPTVPVTKEVVA